MAVDYYKKLLTKAQFCIIMIVIMMCTKPDKLYWACTDFIPNCQAKDKETT